MRQWAELDMVIQSVTMLCLQCDAGINIVTEKPRTLLILAWNVEINNMISSLYNA